MTVEIISSRSGHAGALPARAVRGSGPRRNPRRQTPGGFRSRRRPPNGARFIHSIASSSDLVLISQKPETRSPVRPNGPRLTLPWPLPILDPRALRRRMQALARLHDAGLDHLLVELAHRRQQFRARHHAGFCILAGLHNHHESHRHAPFVSLGPTTASAFINKTTGVLRHRHVGENYFKDNCRGGAHSEF